MFDDGNAECISCGRGSGPIRPAAAAAADAEDEEVVEVEVCGPGGGCDWVLLTPCSC